MSTTVTTLSSRFNTCLALCWQFDGLKDDAAQGEAFATSYGVTAMTWAAAEQQGIVDHGIEDATKDDCARILRSMYWNACHCSNLLPGVDLMVFNDAMVSDALIEKLCVADEAYYAALRNAPLFLRGWTRREEFMAAQAKTMAAA